MAGKANVFDAARDAAAVLEKLDDDQRQLALRFVADALGIRLKAEQPSEDDLVDDDGNDEGEADGGSHRRDRDTHVSPQKFIDEKSPESKMEEVACLAFYLTRYRDQRKWKPADIESLNEEAGGHAFEMVSRDVSNAKQAGVVTPSGGLWQITRVGEKLVDALPDRDKVKAVRKSARKPAKRSARKPSKGSAKK
jgi:hypothetical protein